MTHLELIDATDWRVEPTWRALEQVARPVYFLTWGWIENWLACLPAGEAPQLAVFHAGGRPIAAAMLGHRWLVRHHVVPSRAIFLNATGRPARDELCVEHNGLLQVPGTTVSLAALARVLPHHWDEIFLPAVDEAAFASLDAGPHRVLIDREVAAPFVDLEAVRRRGDYLALLGHKTRGQIRRARRELGPLQVEVAADLRAALATFDELIALHAAQWHKRGLPGAFADPWIEQFHRRLIERRLPHGEIQLLRVRAGECTIGCLYSFIANGRVHVYQSGFAAFDDPHIKPGYLCHAAAVEYDAAAGHAIYDPLGGDARYKEQLATGATRLRWLRIQRRLPWFALEARLRSWKHARARTGVDVPAARPGIG